MNKIIIITFQILLLLVIAYLLYVNITNISNISFVLNSSVMEIKTSILIIAVYSIGFTAGMMQFLFNKELYRSQIEFYARKNEKLSQQNEIDTDSKEVLERKIAALEIALQNAIKNKE